MSVGWVWLLVVAACAGLVAVPVLSAVGMRLLGVPTARARPAVVVLSAAAGVLAGACGALAAWRAGSPWWLAGLVPWAVFVVSAAVCDARVQRIPTVLVWAGAAVTGAGLVVAAAGTGQWRPLVASGVAAAAAGLVLVVCWRFAGAGFGDVRLAVLGGLGLGHSRPAALLLGVVAFAVVLAVQVGVVYARTRDRTAMLPYGPALAVAFLVASAA